MIAPVRTHHTDPVARVRIKGRGIVPLYADAALLGWCVYSTFATLAVGHRTLGRAIKAARARLVLMAEMASGDGA